MKEFGRMKRILFATSLLVGATLCGGTSTAMAQQPKHQTVTINAKSMSVKQFFAEVKKQTGLNFIYSQGKRIKLRCPPKVLTGTLHPSLPSIFSG